MLIKLATMALDLDHRVALDEVGDAVPKHARLEIQRRVGLDLVVDGPGWQAAVSFSVGGVFGLVPALGQVASVGGVQIVGVVEEVAVSLLRCSRRIGELLEDVVVVLGLEPRAQGVEIHLAGCLGASDAGLDLAERAGGVVDAQPVEHVEVGAEAGPGSGEGDEEIGRGGAGGQAEALVGWEVADLHRRAVVVVHHAVEGVGVASEEQVDLVLAPAGSAVLRGVPLRDGAGTVGESPVGELWGRGRCQLAKAGDGAETVGGGVDDGGGPLGQDDRAAGREAQQQLGDEGADFLAHPVGDGHRVFARQSGHVATVQAREILTQCPCERLAVRGEQRLGQGLDAVDDGPEIGEHGERVADVGDGAVEHASEEDGWEGAGERPAGGQGDDDASDRLRVELLLQSVDEAVDEGHSSNVGRDGSGRQTGGDVPRAQGAQGVSVDLDGVFVGMARELLQVGQERDGGLLAKSQLDPGHALGLQRGRGRTQTGHRPGHRVALVSGRGVALRRDPFDDGDGVPDGIVVPARQLLDSGGVAPGLQIAHGLEAEGCVFLREGWCALVLVAWHAFGGMALGIYWVALRGLDFRRIRDAGFWSGGEWTSRTGSCRSSAGVRWGKVTRYLSASQKESA